MTRALLTGLLLWAGIVWPLAPARAATIDVDASRHVLITLANRPQPGLRRAGSTWRGYEWSGNYDASVSVQRRVRALSREYDLTRVDEWSIDLLDEHCVVLRIAEGSTRADVLRALSTDERISLAQPLNEFDAQAGAAAGVAGRTQYAITALQLPFAHRYATGRGVRVALIDTGVSEAHPALAGRIAYRKDFTERAASDDDRHGTALAGVLVGRANDTLGVVGVAPDVQLHVMQACWPRAGTAGKARCNSFTLSRAIGAAADIDAQVLNLSLAGPPDPLLDRMLVKLIGRGATVIAAVPEPAAGQPGFPASTPGVISVRRGEPGPGADADVALPAPGTDVLTTIPRDRYDYVSGSSIAAAHVTGVVALLKELRSDLQPAAIVELLLAAVPEPVGADTAGGAATVAPISLSACLAVARTLQQPDLCSRSP